MPPLIVTDSNYEFTPPHHGNLWPRLLARFAVRLTKKRYGITEVEIRQQQRLAELISQGHGILLAPNHCRMSDAMVLQSLSQSLRQRQGSSSRGCRGIRRHRPRRQTRRSREN